MEKIVPERKQFCIDIFGEEEGSKVYEFYSRTLKIKSYSGDVRGAKSLSKTERIKLSITSLVEECGKEAIVKGMEKFQKSLSSGELVNASVHIFNETVRRISKYEEGKVTANPLISQVEEQHKTIPIRHQQIYKGEYSAHPDFEWNYICSRCKGTFDRWAFPDCPHCNSRILWSKIQS